MTTTSTRDAEPNGGSRPVPDPTVLTTQAVDKAVGAERQATEAKLEVLRERLRGIDHATELLAKNLEFIRSDVIANITTAVGCAQDLTNEKFASISQQFLERDTRTETVSALNKVALDAAFAAQKEAASEQNKSNTLAITKSETATTETINKLAELFKTTTDGLSDKIDDLKQRQSVFESTLVGIDQSRTGGTAAITSQRETQAAQRAIMAQVISVVLFLMAVASFAFAVAKP